MKLHVVCKKSFLLVLLGLAIAGCKKNNDNQPFTHNGDYLATAFYLRYTPSGTDSTWVVYNDTLHVNDNTDTSILVNNEQFNYNSSLSNDTVTVYGYGYHYSVSTVTFYKADKDSISTFFNSGVNGGMNIRKYGRRMN
jgi:hypothetical protein